MINSNLINQESINLSKKHPDDNSPITFNKQGEVVSVFKDDIWDLSEITFGFIANRPLLNFTEEETGLNRDTLFHLKLAIYYDLFYAKRQKDVLTFRTIIGKYFKYRTVATLFKGKGSSFLNLKKNGVAKKQYLLNLSLNTEITIKTHAFSCENLNRIGAFYNIEDFGFEHSYIKKIRDLSSKSIRQIKQTILIPSRIYSEFIKSGLDVFEKFERSSRDIKEVFINSNFSALNPNTGRVKHLFKEFIIKNNLQNFQNDFDIKTQADFLRCIQYIQNIGFLLIACFSGMRKAEVLSLPQNCLNINKIKSNNLGVNALENKLVYSLHGYTSKTSTDGIRTATWITCKEVEKVIHSLNDIVIIAKAYNDQNGLYKGIEIEKYPLFCHLCFARKFEIEAMFSIYEYPVALLNGLKLSVDRLVKNTELNEDDLAELYRFNPLIDWLHTYNLEIGKKWGFRPHQFRRSLVVYGVRSGMIQLSVLKKQLQHLNIDMTTYYGK